ESNCLTVTAYQSERAWSKTGGGARIVFERPGYQVETVSFEGKMRTLPDVALLGDPDNPGFFIVRRGSIGTIAGTSASTPPYAGIFALANQFAQTSGVGSAIPRLYQLGAAMLQGGPAAFDDIIEGRNDSGRVRGFGAAAGYDLVTGWGS